MSGNSNPVITSSAATGSFSEDANTTGSTVDHVLTGTMNFTDSDHSDTHTTTTALKTAVWSGGSTLPVGALTKFQAGLTSSIVSDSNGSGKLKWTFSEDDRDFDFLAKSETLVLTYEITLKDNHGGSTKKTVKITVTGTDDKPVFATTAGATLSEQANKTLSLSPDTAHIALQFTDVDLNNTGHTASVLSVSATGNTSGILPGSYGTAELMSFFDINNVVKNAGSSNGVGQHDVLGARPCLRLSGGRRADPDHLCGAGRRQERRLEHAERGRHGERHQRQARGAGVP